jgi:hypothetical protein
MRLFLTAVALATVGFPLAASTVFIGTDVGQIGTLDTVTWVFTQIRNSGPGLDGLAFDVFGNLDAVGLGSAPNIDFDRVDPATGNVTFVAKTNNQSGAASLASKPGGGTLYLADHINLYTVDPLTGAATVIGSDGIPPAAHNLFDIGFGPDGVLYGFYTTTLYRFNTGTGVATVIGSTGFPIYDLFPADGILYGLDNSANLFSVNTSTGAATLLRHINGINGTVFGTAVAASPTPEPHTGISAAGLLLLCWLRRPTCQR